MTARLRDLFCLFQAGRALGCGLLRRRSGGWLPEGPYSGSGVMARWYSETDMFRTLDTPLGRVTIW